MEADTTAHHFHGGGYADLQVGYEIFDNLIFISYPDRAVGTVRGVHPDNFAN